jgi:uncharacterized protein YndB with AHSA1/START domain
VTEIEREVVLPAPPDEVWDVVTEHMDDWFGAEPTGDLSPGEVAHFVAPDGTERRALTETMEPPRRLAFRWLPEEGRSGSRVEIEIDEVEDGSRLRITETLVDAAVDPVPHIGFRPLARV